MCATNAPSFNWRIFKVSKVICGCQSSQFCNVNIYSLFCFLISGGKTSISLQCHCVWDYSTHETPLLPVPVFWELFLATMSHSLLVLFFWWDSKKQNKTLSSFSHLYHHDQLCILTHALLPCLNNFFCLEIQHFWRSESFCVACLLYFQVLLCLLVNHTIVLPIGPTGLTAAAIFHILVAGQ